eukprot:gene3804-6965_t
MKLIGILFFVIILTIVSSRPLPRWKHCYKEPISEDIIIHSAGVELSNERVNLSVNMTLRKPIESGRYQFEIWHSGTGDKIQYKGPYDICCGFIKGTTCLKDKTSECPLKDNIQGFVSKPLYKNYKGLYEATLIIFNSSNEEVLCIDAPFLNRIENKQENTVIQLNKTNEANYIDPKGKEITIKETKEEK